MNFQYIKDIIFKGLVTGINNVGNMSINSSDKNCEACVQGKMHHKSFPKKSQSRATKILELVHSDLCGPMQVNSIGGSRYVLTFTDDYSEKEK